MHLDRANYNINAAKEGCVFSRIQIWMDSMLYWANRAEIECTYGPGFKVLSLLLQSKLLLLIAHAVEHQ